MKSERWPQVREVLDRAIALPADQRVPYLDEVCSGDAELRSEVVASLDHPNIARLLDGGSDDGVPYLVMELIEGTRIHSYCDERRLPVTERLRLFRDLVRRQPERVAQGERARPRQSQWLRLHSGVGGRGKARQGGRRAQRTTRRRSLRGERSGGLTRRPCTLTVRYRRRPSAQSTMGIEVTRGS